MEKASKLAVIVTVVFWASFSIAQGVIQRFDSNAILSPGVTLQSQGTSFGQIANVASNLWALGSGTSRTVNSAPALTWDTNQAILIGPKTSSQIATLAPTASGYMLINITTAGLCISTGTGAGAWVYVSTSPTPTAKAVCY